MAGAVGWVWRATLRRSSHREKARLLPIVLEGRCLQRLRPIGRKDAEPPFDDNPAKELQAAPLQVPLS